MRRAAAPSLRLTDGEDTFSQSASLESVIAAAQADRFAGLHARAGNRGRDRKRRPPPPGESRRAASIIRRADADQLRAIYEQIAERLSSSYSLVYQSDRKIPDGTLRPVRIFYRGSTRSAGETAVFIPGMVVPAGGWSSFFSACWRG